MFKLGNLSVQENVTVYAELSNDGVVLYVPEKKSKVLAWKNRILYRTDSKGTPMMVWSDNPGIMIALEQKLTNFLSDDSKKQMTLAVNGKRLKLSKGEATCLLRDITSIADVLKKRMVEKTIRNIGTFRFAEDYQ